MRFILAFTTLIFTVNAANNVLVCEPPGVACTSDSAATLSCTGGDVIYDGEQMNAL